MQHKNDETWSNNYATTDALEARHTTWEQYSHVEGKFGIDLLPPESIQGAILDAGCGTGVHLRRLIERYPHSRFVAIDYSAAMVEAASQLCPNAEVLKGDIQNLQWQDDTFAGADCKHVLYHVPDIERAISELHRVIRPGAWCLITTVAIDAGREMLDVHNSCCRLVNRLDWQIDTLPSSRFNTANGGWYIRKYFETITLYPRIASLRFDSVDPALNYYLSMDYFRRIARTEPKTSDTIQLCAAKMIQKIIDTSGFFSISKNCGSWIAYKDD